jgi:hypothetical protein
MRKDLLTKVIEQKTEESISLEVLKICGGGIPETQRVYL